MEYELRTGFQKIKNSITFNPQGIVKGFDLGEAYRVWNIVEYGKDGFGYLLRAEVIRTLSVNETTYKCFLEVSRKAYYDY